MSPSRPQPDGPLGPVEQELVRMLRGLELTELDRGRRERCWQEFRELARIPEPASAPASTDEPAPDRQPAGAPTAAARSAARGSDVAARRLRPLPGSP